MKTHPNIKVVGPGYKPREGDVVIDTTSRASSWSRGLSPFVLGPVKMPSGWPVVWAHNVENVWQFSKVYPEHMKPGMTFIGEANISLTFWSWAVRGWSDIYAHRYPMGRKKKPLFSLWKLDGKYVRLNYVEARWHIYIPIYSKAVHRTDAYSRLRREYLTMKWRQTLCLWDFDGYDHKEKGMDLCDVSSSPMKKMGHAFVLYHLLTGEPIIPGSTQPSWE